jgi:hypothetical protein
MDEEVGGESLSSVEEKRGRPVESSAPPIRVLNRRYPSSSSSVLSRGATSPSIASFERGGMLAHFNRAPTVGGGRRCRGP